MLSELMLCFFACMLISLIMYQFRQTDIVVEKQKRVIVTCSMNSSKQTDIVGCS